MKIKVLDAGYVKLIEAYGHGLDGVGNNVIRQNNQAHNQDVDNEVGIIEAARQSTQGSFRGWDEWICNKCGAVCNANLESHINQMDKINQCNGKLMNDEKLLSFMKRNHHDTPFEFAGMVIEVKAPIFVFREWHRHRTQSYNEMSARYAPLPDENYIPTFERLFMTQEKNKQAQAVDGSEQLTVENAEWWLKELDFVYSNLEKFYQLGLKFGIPKEVARIVLPVGRYSQMRANANLRNWFQFLNLRSTKSNPNAQYEIRMFADAVETIIAEQFPRSYKLFDSMRS